MPSVCDPPRTTLIALAANVSVILGPRALSG
jgi:hypothetical protein